MGKKGCGEEARYFAAELCWLALLVATLYLINPVFQRIEVTPFAPIHTSLSEAVSFAQDHFTTHTILSFRMMVWAFLRTIPSIDRP